MKFVNPKKSSQHIHKNGLELCWEDDNEDQMDLSFIKYDPEL